MLTPQAVREAVRHAAPAGRRRLQHPLHQPQARRDPRAVPRLHRAARRQGHRRWSTRARRQRAAVAADDRRRAAAAAAPARRSAGARVLVVKDLACREPTSSASTLDDIGFEVRAGEIVGIAGVSGNGQQELLAALSGEDPRAPAGVDRAVRPARSAAHSPRRRRARGLHFVPEERLGRGAVPTLCLAQNTLLTRTEAVSRGRLDRHRARVDRLRREHHRRASTSRPAAPARRRRACRAATCRSSSSAARSTPSPKLLIVSQPTWGVDVGAAALIRGELLALRDAGCALLVVSEELDELFEIADRLVVIAQGRLSPSIDTADATIERIGEWMSGLWEAGACLHRPRRSRCRSAPCSSLKPARNRRELMALASPLMALVLTALLGRAAVRRARQGPGAGLAHVLRRAAVAACAQLSEVLLKATPLITHRARAGGVLPLERLEHRRRRAVPARRARRRRRRAVADHARHRAAEGCSLPLVLVGGVLGGMAWAAIVALLRDRFNASEILVSLMLVYVAQQLRQLPGVRPVEGPGGLQLPADARPSTPSTWMPQPAARHAAAHRHR